MKGNIRHKLNICEISFTFDGWHIISSKLEFHLSSSQVGNIINLCQLLYHATLFQYNIFLILNPNRYPLMQN